MSPSMDDLDGRQFTSVSVTRDDADPALVPDTEITLTFGDGLISADAGCNRIAGRVGLEGAELVADGRIGPVTKMACPGPREAQDQWLSELLASRPTVALEGEILTLTQGSTTIVATDARSSLPVEPSSS